MEIIAELEDSPRGVYCGAVGFLAPPARGDARRPLQRADPHGGARHARPPPRSTAWAAASRGTRAPRREYDETVAKARVLTARRPRFELFETLRHDPGEGFRHLDRHLDRLRGIRRVLRVRDPTRTPWCERPRRRRAGSPIDPRACACRSTVGGASTSGATALVDVTRSGAPCRSTCDHPVDHADPMLFHKHSLRARYDDALARHPDADDVLLVNDRGEITESTIANVAVLDRRAVADAAARRGPAAGRRPRGRPRGGLARGRHDPRGRPRSEPTRSSW